VVARFVLSLSSILTRPWSYWAMRETEKWMELCAQAANEQDSRKLMALIKQITALLDAKQQRFIEIDSKRERTD
jgi:hypothetical protein